MNPLASPHVQTSPWIWVGFLVLVIVVLSIDNLVVDRKAHRVSQKEALFWSAVWIGLSLAFAGGLALWDGAGPAVSSKFLSGYLLEWSLSVDNLFVFLLIFGHYKVPQQYHHKVLSWGIYGAMVMRALFIGLGSAVVSRWAWVLYLFGAFLVYTGIKLLFHKGEDQINPEQSPILKVAHRLFNVTKGWRGDRFFVREKGRNWVTPLFVIVLIVEASDVVFAVDSIPAVFGVTTDPFIVYTSNIFAILGLRSMFFALEGVMHMFRFLKVGLSMILTLIGLKMLFLHWAEQKLGFQAGEYAVLGAIVAILVASILASLLWWEKPAPARRKRARA